MSLPDADGPVGTGLATGGTATVVDGATVEVVDGVGAVGGPRLVVVAAVVEVVVAPVVVVDPEAELNTSRSTPNAGLGELSARTTPKCCSPSTVEAPPLSSRRSYQ